MYRLDFVKKNNFDMVLTQFSDFSLNRGPGPGPRSKVPRPGVTLILTIALGSMLKSVNARFRFVPKRYYL